MKLKRTAISSAVIVSISLLAVTAHAQDTELKRVEITGSSIKRIVAEGALPVQVITSAQIQRSGATSVAEVLQRMPAMQGFQVVEASVGSNAGGATTASLHDIGASYTLVLLNGRRIAPNGNGGSSVNLNSIPMSAIERIEVLTDGASALYGSDAIAGVVNFVMKRNAPGGTIEARTNRPLEGGGASTNASLTYGFGDVEADGYSFVATVRKDNNDRLLAGDRKFASTAYREFEYQGKRYIYDQTSTFAGPGNVNLTFKKVAGQPDLPAYSFNPYQKANGKCLGPKNVLSLNNAVSATSVTENCAFDFASTIEPIPENKRDSMFLTGQVKVGSNWTLFSDLSFTRLNIRTLIAANAVPVPLAATSELFTQYVAPYLTGAQLARGVATIDSSFRAVDFGGRESTIVTDAKHFVVGAEGNIGQWSLNGAYTVSENTVAEDYIGGYFKNFEFRDMLAKRQIDPFAVPGNPSAATKLLIDNSIFNGTVRSAGTSLKGIDVRASSDVFTLPAGAVSLGLGADFKTASFSQTPSPSAVAGEIYNYTAQRKYDLSRDVMGAFAEVLFPVTKTLELTTAVRYDKTTAITDNVRNLKVGKDMASPTYKVAGRFQPSKTLLFRGSYGTGFKAPSLLEIAQPEVPNGVTGSAYDCPFPGTAACKPGKLQYSQLAGGNELLEPEKSTQSTLGMRFEPNNDFSVGLDYWQVKIKDAVSAVSADQAFASPSTFSSLFKLYRTPAESQDFWAFRSVSTNIGQANTAGIDWDVVMRAKTDLGRLTGTVAGTFIIDSSYTRPGTENDFTDSMNRYGINTAVTFKHIVRASMTLDTGKFSNTLTYKWRNGYADRLATVRDVATNLNTTLSMDVPAYGTFDWQGVYNPSKSLEFRAGLMNVLNTEPPLTLRSGNGQQVGYDGRYADAMMRTFYLAGTFRF